jgi:dTDP-L-rhamnose 4-epimerase
VSGVVLVTGGAGFIGRHVVAALYGRGEHVRVLDSFEERVHGKSALPRVSGAETRIGSVTDPSAWATVVNDVDRIVHLAAYQDYLPDFSRFFQVNVVGTALMYEIAVERDLPIRRIVIASSQSVYGEGAYICQEHGLNYPPPRTEARLRLGQWDLVCPVGQEPLVPTWARESRVGPQSPYAISKRAEEELALRLGERYGYPTTALRYSIVQGPGQSFRNAYSGALRSFAVRVLNHERPVVFEDGGQIRDYVSVNDAVSATLKALDEDHLSGQALNVGGGTSISVLELANMVIAESGAGVEPLISGAYRVGDVRHALSDITGLRAAGWSPDGTQRVTVRSYLEWATKQPELHDTFVSAERRMRELGVLRDSIEASA